jgi:hypothetical protein
MNEHPDFSTQRKWWRSALVLAVVMVLVLSCSIGAPAATSTPKPTDTAMPTDTTVPTDTPQPTATKKATANKAATQRAQQQDTAAAATEFAGAVLGEVQSKLDEVGEMMGSGSVIFWNSDPIAVESSSPNTLNPQLIDQSIQGANFAFHSNITWEVKQKIGIVYCAFMFRISGNLDMEPWYMMRMGRISGLGHILFDVLQQWSIIGESNGDISDYIKTGNGDTNDVLLVARENQFKAYVNGHQVSVWWNTKIDQGGFGLGTMQDTGASVCTFGDTWIWSYN